jgi:serine/threonine protein kinase
MSNTSSLNEDTDATELEDFKQVNFPQNKAEYVDSALSSTGFFQIDPDAEPLKVGSVINKRFELTLEIGEGGMGAVYKAIDRVSQEAEARNYYVAVKVLKPELSSNKQLFQLLHREFERTKRLVHKNIIDVRDFDRDRELGCIYMTMEYLTGQTLSKLIKQSAPYTLQSVWSIIDGIGQGLSFAHKNNIVHRDIKPGNVFITDEGIPKILDFGIASKINEQENDHTKISGHNLGGLTVTYASPEMLKDFEPDPSDDIYAFGCVIYELLTGKKFYNQKITEPEPIKGLTHRQMQALTKSLASTRNKRTKSIDELLEGLKPSKKSNDVFTLFKSKYIAIGSAVMTIAGVFVFLFINQSGDTKPSLNVVQSSVINIQSMRDDSGMSDNDFYTNDNQPEFFGEADKEAEITISLTNSTQKIAEKTMTTSSKGAWSMNQKDAEPLKDGTYTLTVSMIQGEEKFIKEQIITIDTISPEISISTINLESVVNKKDILIKDNRILLSGTAESGATVTATLQNVLTNTNLLERSIIAANSAWSLDASDIELPSGKYKLTVSAKDNAANEVLVADKFIIIEKNGTTTETVTSASSVINTYQSSIKLRLPKSNYRIGNNLMFYYSVSKPMYVQAVHRDMKGEVTVLSPNTAQLKPNIEYQFPPKNAKFLFKVQGPAGSDSITLIGNEKPIPSKTKILNADGRISAEIQNEDFFSTQLNYDVLQ